MYELFLEGQRADIDQKISILISYAIDDINQFGNRNTSFSKTIVLPGTGTNNRIFGHTHELGSFNDYSPGAPNVDFNFNAAQPTKAEIRYNGLLIVKGIFRLTQIIRNDKFIEYEGSVFGELAGFAAAIGNRKLEDLNFSEYNHDYTVANIVGSWEEERSIFTNIGFVTSDNTIRYFGDDIRGVVKAGDTIIINGSNLNDGSYTVVKVTRRNFNPFFRNDIEVVETLNFEAINCTITLPGIGGYYYPLIDYGNVSTNKIDYKYTTFRPALFVKEYIEKIFTDSGYTYESEFFESDIFKRLIIPLNAKRFERLESKLLDIYLPTPTPDFEVWNGINSADRQTYLNYIEVINTAFTKLSDAHYRYDETSAQINYEFTFNGYYNNESTYPIQPYLFIEIYTQSGNYYKKWEYRPNRTGTAGNGWPIWNNQNKNININYSETITLNNNDVLITRIYTYRAGFVCNSSTLKITAIKPILVESQIGNFVNINDYIPKNILQKDFFTWIMKMFNLYVDEDKFEEKKLIIKPYINYYDQSKYVDWSYKIARDKTWSITPMGMLNGRFIDCKFKTDNDFYNENYRKKYNLSYGDVQFDTGFQFAKESQKIEVGFSPSVLVQYDDTDKVLPAIYKKSGGNNAQEDPTDSNIRILIAKKITGVTAWDILNLAGDTPLSGGANLTGYGYAGHLNDPITPTFDLNFGAPNEIFFEPDNLTLNTLFNTYWAPYIAEIADKDSKLLKAHVYLTPLDIAQLDFSIPVFIDGVTWRINKVEDYDATNNELVKVELLKIIDTSYEVPMPTVTICGTKWTTKNYDGTKFRNGDDIPQITDTTAWANATTAAWCYYNNDSANGTIYGKLYNWYAVTDPRGFAPEGYRVPTDIDWTNLVTCLSGDSVAGGKMKATGTIEDNTGLWYDPNTSATNSSGFNGLPAGSRGGGGGFTNLGYNTSLWSSTEVSANNAWNRYLSNNSITVGRYSNNKRCGFSVRLIKE